MNTGHDGSLSTGHANSAIDMLHRLEMMVLMGVELPLRAVQGQVASGLDILIHLGRRANGARRLLEIWEVLDCTDGVYNLNQLVQCREVNEKGENDCIWERVGELVRQEKLIRG